MKSILIISALFLMATEIEATPPIPIEAAPLFEPPDFFWERFAGARDVIIGIPSLEEDSKTKFEFQMRDVTFIKGGSNESTINVTLDLQHYTYDSLSEFLQKIRDHENKRLIIFTSGFVRKNGSFTYNLIPYHSNLSIKESLLQSRRIMNSSSMLADGKLYINFRQFDPDDVKTRKYINMLQSRRSFSDAMQWLMTPGNASLREIISGMDDLTPLPKVSRKKNSRDNVYTEYGTCKLVFVIDALNCVLSTLHKNYFFISAPYSSDVVRRYELINSWRLYLYIIGEGDFL